MILINKTMTTNKCFRGCFKSFGRVYSTLPVNEIPTFILKILWGGHLARPCVSYFVAQMLGFVPQPNLRKLT